ncbi:uncharacterized protein si:rp71-46j2.7 isoform X2 [Boleophthalmus pectinirostris]|uniref:uncharacterized protein si:rp71-46j2.7 isoform X2 n=1 Tax=Boleophthalmus pectinirostris TaxID=150288 RepID=UPI00242C44A0|nr:uncharacterized protein si:rp71-46j2.7 isoform X2 [Boleophthalmus pectinirostris]
MYLWRFSIAITLGLVWYFTDCGRTIAQYFLGFLLCFTTPLLWGNAGRESSTQTDEHSQERSLLETIGEQLFGDLSDGASGSKPESLESHYPQVKASLQQVFECAYAQLVLPWYIVPEPCEDQPLHQVLSREFDFVIDRIIDRAKDFDVCQAVVGSIRILTQHLHNARQSDRSRVEEVAVLREFSDALVRNLFPKSLWGQEVNHCALNEIVALKGLGLLVTWLSDPDNLNHLVVSQLDSASPKGSLYEPDPEQTSLTSQDYEADVEHEGEGSEVSLEGAGLESSNGIKGKKRDKLRKGWNRFVDKMKLKKAKKKKMKQMEHELVRRIMAIQGDVPNEEDVSSREGSVHSQQDSDREDSDLENYLTSVQEDMMEFKLSYEMWRVGQWAVSIPQADVENEELFFTVHLEEKCSPENLQWDIRKSYHDVIYFYNRWQDSSSLPTILILEENQEMDEVKEETRLSVEHFLQEVVSDEIMGHSQPVFQFLCPLDKLLNEEVHYGGVWGLLSGLAYFLTPGQEEEEMGSPQNEFPKEVTMSHPKSKSPPDSPSIASARDISSSTIPTIIISPCDTAEEPPKENEAENELPSATTSAQDRTEDSDNPITSHFKMLFKGLSHSKSQESLSQPKITDDEEQSSQNSEAETAEVSTQHSIFARSNKKEKISFKVSNGSSKAKTKDQGTLPRGEDYSGQKCQANWEQQETTKVIFDLLKEISGNSILLNIFDAILKPVMPILKKKINSFLSKMNPTEAQMAAYIDTLRAKLWPSSPAAPSAPRTEEEKNQTRERAHSLINAKYSNVLVLKKTDMETVFNIFQDSEANKTLVYMLLSFLLREFLPNEHCLNVSTAVLQKVTNI